MKQCPNSNCIIYTRLDELPDTYTRCPQCGTPLVEGVLTSSRLDSSMLAEEETSPYRPPARPSAPLPRKPPVTYEEYAEPYDEDVYDDTDVDAGAPPALVPRISFPVRGVGIGVGVLAFIVGCLALVVILTGRFLPHQSPVSSALATETAVAWLRPPVNTPITLLPTLPASGTVLQPPPGNSGQAPQPTLAPLPASSTSPAPVDDALMCAHLDSGQPVGTTSAYKPSDPLNLAVKAGYGPGGVTSVLTRWYGPDGAQLYEMKQNYTRPGNYYAGFTLTKTAPWTPGDYRVDIYTNGSTQVAQSVQFSVVP